MLLIEKLEEIVKLQVEAIKNIKNGTNEEENERIRQTLRLAKQNIEASFKNGHYFESFITLFTR